MDRLTRTEVRLLAEVAEVKRIYTSVANRVAGFQSPSIVLTSAEKGEGKTSMAALLSAVASQYGRRNVLAIDLHWHRPSLHEHFGVERSLSLEGGTDLLDQVVPSGLNGLSLLTAPAAAPGERLTSGEVLSLILSTLEKAKTRFNLIILDTAGLFPTNRYMLDPVVLASAADVAALVVLSGVTPRQSARKAMISLETAGATVIGAIVNQWKNPIKV